jgi:hypothetical protein
LDSLLAAIILARKLFAMRKLFLCLLLLECNLSIAQSWKPIEFKFDTTTNGNNKTGLINCSSLYLHPNKKNIRWLLSPKGGLYVSKDGGSNWIICIGSNLIPTCELTGIAADPFNENILYLATNNYNNCGGLWKSINGGNSFVQLPNFSLAVNEIVVSPTNRHLLHIATSDGIYKSLNGGVTFSKINGLPSINFFNVKRNTNKNSHFIYATSNSSFYLSSDEGLTWNSSLVINQSLCHEIGLSNSDSNCVYLYNNNNNGEVYVSNNKGISFSILKNSSAPILNGITSNDSIYNSNSNGFIIPDAINSNSFYVGTKIIYRYLSSTGFNPMITYQQQLPGLIHELKWSDAGDTLYACTSGGLYRSIDNAITWTYAMQGVKSLEGYAMKINSDSWNIITSQNGVFQLRSDTIKSTNLNIVYSIDSIIQDVIDTNLWFKISIANTVAYKNQIGTSWVTLVGGLPTRCKIMDLKFDYHSWPNRLIALTDGCGIYSIQFDSLRTLKAGFTLQNDIICNFDSIKINDKSTGQPDSVRWYFTGTSTQTSNERNPAILINDIRSFTIQQIVYKGTISDTSFYSSYSINNPDLYCIDSANTIGGFFSDSIIHSIPSNYQWTIASTDSIHTNAYVFPNYWVNAEGAEETLLSNVFMLRDSSNAALRFNYAYTNYSLEYSDTLIIKARLLCLNKEITLFHKGGSSLRTTNDSLTIAFHPNSNEWRSDSLDLSFGVGAGPMKIIIENKGHYGNNLYLDSLQIDSNYLSSDFLIAVNFFIEGYYAGQRWMRATLYNGGISNNENETDSFRLQLLDKNNPSQIIYETSGTVKTDGSSQVYIPVNYSSDSYYLGLITRNGITVYTKAPVHLSRWGFQEWELRW